MTDRCEPPPELRGEDGWHWVEYPSGYQMAARWWLERTVWRWMGMSSYDASLLRYITPVATPVEFKAIVDMAGRFGAEVEALGAEVERLRDALEWVRLLELMMRVPGREITHVTTFNERRDVARIRADARAALKQEPGA